MRNNKKTWLVSLALGCALGGVALAATGVRTFSPAGTIPALKVFSNAAGSMMVIVDSRGSHLYVHDGVMMMGLHPGGGAVNSDENLPDPGSPWGVCGSDTNVSCESGYFQQKCKLKDGSDGVQICAQNTCECLGSDGPYTANSSPVCNSCLVPTAPAPAQTLPAF